MNIHSDRATALVTTWEVELGRRAWGEGAPGALEITRDIRMTNDVRDRMRDDIVKLINLSIVDLTAVPPPS